MDWGPPEWEFWAWAKASFCCRSLHPEVAKAHPCAHRSPTAEPSSLSCSSRAGRSIAGSSPGTQLPALRGRGLAGVRHSGEESKALAGSSPHLPVLLSLYSHCSCPSCPSIPIVLSLSSQCSCPSIPTVPALLPLNSLSSCPHPSLRCSAGASLPLPPHLCRCRWSCGVSPAAPKSRSWPPGPPGPLWTPWTPQPPVGLQDPLQDLECPAGPAWAVPGSPAPALLWGNIRHRDTGTALCSQPLPTSYVLM